MFEPRRSLPLIALGLIAAVVPMLLWLAAQRQNPDFKPWPPEDRKSFNMDIVLPTLHGDTLRLADFQGYVVLVNFWATWCYPCRAEMPSMNALYLSYRDKGFTIVAVASDTQGRAIVAPYADQHNLAFPILLDPQNTIGSRLQLSGIPTSYLLDQYGRVASLQVGARDWNGRHMRRLINALLAEARK